MGRPARVGPDTQKAIWAIHALRRVHTIGPPWHMVFCNDSVSVVVAALVPPAELPTPPTHRGKLPPGWERMTSSMRDTRNQSVSFLTHNRQVAPDLLVVQATSGFNHTEVLLHLLESGLAFHGLSAGGKKWGKLATFLTKFRAFSFQVEHRLPFMLLLEDDVVLRKDHFRPYLGRACAFYDANPSVTILQLEGYAEALLISLAGARMMVNRVRETGIRKNDDQQMLDERLMPGITIERRMRVGRSLERGLPKPWVLGRSTWSSKGHIYRSRRITWAEMAMLKALTYPPSRRLPSFGNPDFTDYMVQ